MAGIDFYEGLMKTTQYVSRKHFLAEKKPRETQLREQDLLSFVPDAGGDLCADKATISGTN